MCWRPTKAAQAATQDQASARLCSALSADAGPGPAGDAARDAALTMVQECPHCGRSIVILVVVGASLVPGATENSPDGE
jgi:hypothetical protein